MTEMQPLQTVLPVRRRISRRWLVSALLALLPAALAALPSDGWEPIGPDTGKVTALAEAPNGRTLYAGSERAGIFKSKNGGRSWTRLPGSPAAVTALALDERSPSTVLAGTAVGLFASRDGGARWQRIEPGIQGLGAASAVTALFADPHRPGTVWAAFGPARRLLRSSDGGASWKVRDYGMKRVFVSSLAAHPGRDGWLYAATSNGVYATHDGGDHWFRLGLRNKAAVSVAVDAASQETVHAVTVEAINHYGITADHLYLFSPATSGVFRDDRGEVPGDGVYTRVAGDPQRPGVTYAATSVGLFVQRTSGGEWQRLDAQPAGAVQPRRFRGPGLFLIPDWFSDGALLLSADDGETWRSVNRGLNLGYLSQVTADPTAPGHLFAINGWSELWRSLDAGETWSRIAGEIPLNGFRELLPDPGHPGTFYLAAALGLWRSTDGGDHWHGFGLAPQAIALDPGPFDALYGGDGIRPVLYRLSEGGEDWEELPAAAGFYSSVLTISPVPSEGGAPRPLYANGYDITFDGPYIYHDRLRRSTDGGASWTTLLIPTRGDAFFNDLEVAAVPGAPARIYAAFNELDGNFQPVAGSVFRSVDDGLTWDRLALTPARPPVSTLALDPGDPLHLFAGTPGGKVFESRNGGTTWTSVTGDLPGAAVADLELDPNDPHRLYVALLGAGAYRRDF